MFPRPSHSESRVLGPGVVERLTGVSETGDPVRQVFEVLGDVCTPGPTPVNNNRSLSLAPNLGVGPPLLRRPVSESPVTERGYETPVVLQSDSPGVGRDRSSGDSPSPLEKAGAKTTPP